MFVYLPMAIHSLYGEGSFDVLLHNLLDRKRLMSQRMLLPPVLARQDEQWFQEKLGLSNGPKPSHLIRLGEIDAMEPTEFERWVLAQFIAGGWEALRTQASHDGGADGVLMHRSTDSRLILQCKHRQTPSAVVADDVVSELLTARARYRVDARLVGITNARAFSASVIEAAMAHDVSLIARDRLPDLCLACS